MTRRGSILTACGRYVLLVWLVFFWASVSSAAEKVRVYPFGEADPDGDVGETVLETLDIQTPPDLDADGNFVADAAGEFVPLTAEGEPLYVEGRDGIDSLAIEFDGLDDRLTSVAFDPRNFSTFAALSQAWVRPNSAGMGRRQAIWSLGGDNGGAGITADGRWELIGSSIIPDTPSDVEVVFDNWTHVAVFRGGNGARLFIDGTLVASGDNFWNGVGPVTVGNRANGVNEEFFLGAIDDFNIAGFSDFAFDAGTDIDFFDKPESGVLGDVNQDGEVNAADYDEWAKNVGFDNGLGGGDGNTLRMGDVDQNGRINYFDFQIILSQADELPARELDPSGVIAAEDFFYNQPTKVLGPGGGFTLQDYGGGRGLWNGRWVSIGNGIITGADYEPKELQFQGLTTPGLSANSLDRDFDVSQLPANQPLYFSVRFMTLEGQQPVGRFTINAPGDELAEISIGIDYETGFDAKLGTLVEFPFDFIPVEPGVLHTLVGKLEINADGNDEVLTAWFDPDDVEAGDFEVFVQADVVASVDELTGELRLDRGTSGNGAILWDDLAVGTSWGAVMGAEVPRLELRIDGDTGDVRLVNGTGAGVELNYYHLASASGSLDADGWNSLSEGDPDNWARNNPSPELLTESSFGGSHTIAAGGELNLGRVLDPGGAPDIVARYGTTASLFNVASVDRDSDGTFDEADNCPSISNADQADSDGDGFGDVCDNCPEVANGGQEDLDGDGVGSLCDDDLVNTLRDWSATGLQGENNMYYGYFDRSDDLALGGDGEYEAEKFTPFLNDGSEIITPDEFVWRESPNHWTGAAWDLTSANNAPWTFLAPLDVHPNDDSPEAEHWVVRRWESDRTRTVKVIWHTHHENVECGGNGITGLLYHNDARVDQAVVDARDDVGVTREIELSIAAGDTIDLLLNAVGPDGSNDDGCDGSQNWFIVIDLGGGGPSFVRADCNGDGSVDISDAIFSLNLQFGGGQPSPCLEACDTNGDGGGDISDPIFLLNHLFAGGRPPGEPRTCGLDPDPDNSLGCENPSC